MVPPGFEAWAVCVAPKTTLERPSAATKPRTDPRVFIRLLPFRTSGASVLPGRRLLDQVYGLNDRRLIRSDGQRLVKQREGLVAPAQAGLEERHRVDRVRRLAGRLEFGHGVPGALAILRLEPEEAQLP